jgi:hypothetical protein
MGAILLAFGSALVGAVVGAVLGAYLQRKWTPDMSAEIANLRRQVTEFQSKVEAQENARKAQEARARFRPHAEVHGEPPEPQFLVLTADRDFELTRLDYIADTGAMVTFEDVQKSGVRIEMPINSAKVMQVWNLRPRQGSLPVPFQFRCHLSLDGFETESFVEALIQPTWKSVGNAQTFFCKVTLSL